jgi:phosphate transport system protein
MPRETFQQELDQLVADVTELGAEVASSLESAVEAMMSRDAKVVESELGVDARYKARGAQIERACMTLQARQAPVARDLRVLHTTRSVTNHLVRSGALVEHICNAIFETAQYDKDEDLEAILTEMAKAARNIFDEGLGIFRDLDVDRARDLQAGEGFGPRRRHRGEYRVPGNGRAHGGRYETIKGSGPRRGVRPSGTSDQSLAAVGLGPGLRRTNKARE